jgi:hypothetical protein
VRSEDKALRTGYDYIMRYLLRPLFTFWYLDDCLRWAKLVRIGLYVRIWSGEPRWTTSGLGGGRGD